MVPVEQGSGRRLWALAAALQVGLAGVGAEPAVERAAAAEATLVVEGYGRDDHLGHALVSPARLVSGGPLLLAAGGGTKWDEAQNPRNTKRDVLCLFAAEGEDAGRLALAIEGARGGDRFAYDLAFAPGLLGPADAADLVVGAPRGPVVRRAGEFAADERGAVYVFAGDELAAAAPEARLEATDATLILVGPDGGGRFGYAVDAAGDLDGDGVGDVVIGAPGGPLATDCGGTAWLVSGARLRALRGENRRRFALDDPRVGAVPLAVGEAGDRLGSVVAVDGERARIAVAAPQCAWDRQVGGLAVTAGEGRGYVTVVAVGEDGPKPGARLDGGAPCAGFGDALLWFRRPQGPSALAVGAPMRDAEAGAVTLWTPGVGEAPALLGPRPGARFGASLAAAPDGRWLAVGAPNDTAQEEGDALERIFRRGSLALFDVGPELAVDLRTLVLGEESRDHLGFAAAADGEALWVGALAWPGAAGTEVGRVYRVVATERP